MSNSGSSLIKKFKYIAAISSGLKYLNTDLCFIAKNYFSGDLTRSIARENNIEVFEFVNRSNVWKYISENSDKNLIMAFT
ncbi:hypothetical protein, partial [Mycoplasmopsis bovis]|uniref:hypothetical protein n=1 Tax=Mycoplasmopsis bovis TaxID=28903 RepID=UPI003D2C8E1C